MGKLTAYQIQHAKKPGLHGDGGGLYLQVKASGAKSWIFRYRVEGKLRNHGLGSTSLLSLAEAREKALACRKLRLEGIDPIEAKKQARIEAQLEAARAMSFRDCAETYIEAHKAGWKSNKHADQWRRTLESYVYPVFGELPVADVNVALVMRAIEPIWAEKSETASRTRGRIEMVLDWAKVRGYRQGENPALWKGNLSHLLPARSKVQKVQHHPALPYAELPAFWQKLTAQLGMGAQALRFAILTAARSGEVRGATWSEIDFEQATWTIPDERMKAGKEHRVPLSPPAVALLRELYDTRRGELVFPGARGGRPLSDMSLTAVLRRMERGDVKVHGFRSTFRDWTADCTNAMREVAEAALAHTLNNKVEAAYRRSDLFEKRQELMAEWASYCTGVNGRDILKA